MDFLAIPALVALSFVVVSRPRRTHYVSPEFEVREKVLEITRPDPATLALVNFKPEATEVLEASEVPSEPQTDSES